MKRKMKCVNRKTMCAIKIFPYVAYAELLKRAYQTMKCDLAAIYEIINNEPILRRGEMGLLIAVFVDALEVLGENKNQSDVNLALEFINEGNDLFVALAHEFDIDPHFLKKKILDDIKAKCVK